MEDFKKQLQVIRFDLSKQSLGRYQPRWVSGSKDERSVGSSRSTSELQSLEKSKRKKNNRIEKISKAKSYYLLKMKERAKKIMEEEGLDWESALALAKERRAYADAKRGKVKKIYTEHEKKPKAKKSKAERRREKEQRKAQSRKNNPKDRPRRPVQGGAPGLGKR